MFLCVYRRVISCNFNGSSLFSFSLSTYRFVVVFFDVVLTLFMFSFWGFHLRACCEFQPYNPVWTQEIFGASLRHSKRNFKDAFWRCILFTWMCQEWDIRLEASMTLMMMLISMNASSCLKKYFYFSIFCLAD